MNWRKRIVLTLAIVVFAEMLTASVFGNDYSADLAASPAPTNAHTTSAPEPVPIPAIRLGNFIIRVEDEDGIAVRQANITIKQTRHEFIFGGQLPFWLIDPGFADQGDQQAVLQRAEEMFEQVIPSQITWGWVEPERGASDFSRYDFSAGWARQFGKRTLVQHIFWGLYDETAEHNPVWLDELSEREFRAALHQRIVEVQANVGEIDGIVVLNEAMYRNVYNDRLGYDVTPELFAAARTAFPDADLFINENPWQAVDLGLVPPEDLWTPMDNYIAYVRWLDQNGVDFDKVGLQIYLDQSDVEVFGGIGVFVAAVDALLTRFAAETGHSLIITEYGLSAPNRAFRADFLAAFMQMVFANPHVDGFQVFHWLDEQLPDNALVRLDGSLTLAGEAYLRLREGWTTRGEGRTDPQGAFAFSGVFGEYEAVVATGGQEQIYILDLYSDAPREATLIFSPSVGLLNQQLLFLF